MDPDDLVCSCNGHAQKVLVGSSQWETQQFTLP